MITKTNGNLTALLPVEKSFYQGITTYHVNARALHGFLENKRDFSNWITQRISQYGFLEGVDYTIVCPTNLLSKETNKKSLTHKIVKPKNSLCYSNLSKTKSTSRRGGHNKIDYLLSLNAAKELAIVENNAQGKAARRYFISCEEQLSQIAPEIHQQELARWQQSRELAKSPFKSMNNALERMRTRQGKSTAKNHYINESNMLTGIVLGLSVQRYKADNYIQGEVREHLNAVQLERLEYLERANEMLLDSDIQDFEERRFKLVAMLANRFKQAA